MNPTDTAKNIFGHYITLLMEANGLKVDQDTHAEIDAAVESIVDAAVVQAKQEMQSTDAQTAAPNLLRAAEGLLQKVEIYQLNERPYQELKEAVDKARGRA